MSWRGPYYYRSKRDGKSVISLYVGKGITAKQAAEVDILEQKKRKADLEAWRQECYLLKKMDQEEDHVIIQINNLIKAVLVLSGFHCHKGQWRKKYYGKRNYKL